MATKKPDSCDLMSPLHNGNKTFYELWYSCPVHVSLSTFVYALYRAVLANHVMMNPQEPKRFTLTDLGREEIERPARVVSA